MSQEYSTATWRLISMNLFFKVKFHREDTVSSIKDFGDRLLLPLRCSKYSLIVQSGIFLVSVLLWKH